MDSGSQRLSHCFSKKIFAPHQMQLRAPLEMRNLSCDSKNEDLRPYSDKAI